MSDNALQKVIKELSLDYANGKYLNVISSNYGLNRPLFGFDDDLWRAVTKVVALQYKQIFTKFIDILELALGPQITRTTGLSVTAQPGDMKLFVHDVSKIPQVGTLVLDNGSALEETIPYRFVDYANNIIFLTQPVVNTHIESDQDNEQTVLCTVVGSSQISCISTELFPPVPFTIVLDKNSDFEEALEVISNDVTQKLLTCNTSVVYDHKNLECDLKSSTLTRAYASGSYYLTVDDVSIFPETGVLLLGKGVNLFSVTTGYTNGVDFAGSLLDGTIAGYKLAFTGNITASLAGVEAIIKTNGSNTLLIHDIFSVVPAPGDTFSLRPVVEFTGKSVEDSSLNIKYTIPSTYLSSGTTVELLTSSVTAALSTVSILGTNWEVLQNSPNEVEVTVPFDDAQLQTYRSASYLHTKNPSLPTNFTNSTNGIGDTILNLASQPTIESGLYIIDQGGSNEEIVAFYKNDATSVNVPHGLQIIHLPGETVDFYQEYYASTDNPIGDPLVSDVAWPGPYLYDTDFYSPVSISSTLNNGYASSTVLNLDVSAGAGPKALEVDNACTMPQSGTFNIILDSEDITISGVFLKSKSRSTLTSSASISNTVLSVGSVLSKFPNAYGYRILIDPGTANAEIGYVVSSNSGLNTVTLESGLLYNHSSGAIVHLVSDTIVATQIDSNHSGIVPLSSRRPISSTIMPLAEIPYDFFNAEVVKFPISSMTVVNGSSFPTSGGKILISYGDSLKECVNKISPPIIAGSTSPIFLIIGPQFPNVNPYVVEINKGTSSRELIRVTSGGTALSLESDTVFINNHPLLTEVSYLGGDTELVQYTSRSGNTLTFNPPIMLQYIHQKGESVNLALYTSPPFDGTGYPLRMPLDYRERLEYLLDLVRACGVKVTIIQKS